VKKSSQFKRKETREIKWT